MSRRHASPMIAVAAAAISRPLSLPPWRDRAHRFLTCRPWRKGSPLRRCFFAALRAA
jgi:hypothetical protein